MSDSGSRTSRAASAKWASGWLSAKSAGQVHGQHVAAPVLVELVEAGEHLGTQQRAAEPQRPPRQPQLLATVLVVVGEQATHHREGVLLARRDVDEHRVVDPHPRHQLLGDAGHELVVGLLGPHHGALGRLLELGLGLALGVGAGRGVLRLGLLLGPLVLDDVLRCLDDDVAGRVVARPAGAAGDLLELAGPEHALPVAVELREAGEEDGADGHVDPHPQGVGAADDGQQPGLGELLDEAAVLGQHPGVVDADAVAHQLGQGLAEAGAEAEGADAVGDRLLVDLDLRPLEQRGRVLDRGGLGEVHDVDGRLAGLHQLGERLVEVLHGPREVQRDGTLGVRDDRDLPARTTREVLDEERDVAQGRRHQQELRVQELEQRHLPRPPAIGLGVEVELVHHDQADVGRAALAQRDVGQDLRGAADDRGVGVDRGVARQHPDVVGAEDLAEGEELLAHQRLDRRGVEADLVLGQGGDVGTDRDHRLPGPGRRGQDDVAATEQLDDGLVLVRVELEPLLLHPAGERVVHAVGVGGGPEALVEPRHSRARG